MNLNIKSYNATKLKKNFKNINFFVIIQSSNLSLTKSIQIKQNFKKFQFSYYKILDKTTAKNLKTSIFTNFSSIICGFILIVNINANFKKAKLNFEVIAKSLKPTLSLISFKLNNKVYLIKQLKEKNLSYKISIFRLYIIIHSLLKTLYKLICI